MDIIVFIGLSVLMLGVATPFLVIHQARFSQSALLRRRLQALGLPGSAAGGSGGGAGHSRQRLIEGKLKELEKRRNSRSNTLGHLLMQSGISLTIIAYLGCCAGAGLTSFLVLFGVGGMSLPISVIGGVGGAVALPRFVLRQIIKRRQSRFIAHFADALDILVRGARTGLPVGECLRIVGREVPDPCGYEFRMLVDSQRIGMTTEQALQRGLERMPVAEFQFFAVVLVIQQQTGGNLATTLENLSNVLRSRKRLKDKVAAMSSEAKSSAMIIGSLPFLVGGMIYLVNPDYISLLFSTKTGNIIMTGGLLWMAAGILVMQKMINFKV